MSNDHTVFVGLQVGPDWKTLGDQFILGRKNLNL